MRQLLVALAVTVLAAGLVGSATAKSESTSTDVTVTSTTSVDLSPDALSYTLSPGTFNDTSADSYTGVEIENSGSVNITDIYMSTSEPADRPFGTGVASAYDAGNFVQIKPSSEIGGVASESDFQYVSRKEFNESNTLSYFKPPTGVGEVRYGRFRAANESFFWAASYADSSTTANSNNCDGSGSSSLYVGKKPHSETKTGSVDFTDSSNYNKFDIKDAKGELGRVDNVPLNTYEGTKKLTFLIRCGDAGETGPNATYVFGTRWDVSQRSDTGGQYNETSGSLQKLMSNPSNGNELQPGEHFTVFTRISVPYGVANGAVSTGSLTVNVASTND